MKRRTLLFVPIAFLALSIVLPANAVPTMIYEAQMEITGFVLVGVVEQGIRFDVPFVGVAGGPLIKEGTVEGIDYVLIDWEGIGHLNVVLTITDGEGDKIFVHATGLAVTRNPGYTVFEDEQITITDATGKYLTLVGRTFRGEGFISELSMDPPGGTIHVKAYTT